MSINTSTNTTYASYCYDKLNNLSINHEDYHIVLNRGLIIYSESTNGIGVTCKNNSSLFQSIDSKQIVRNLCASQKYHKMGLFITFDLNKSENFGLEEICNWIDSGIRNIFHTIVFNWTHALQKEINTEIEQSSESLFLINWVKKDNIHPLSASK